MDFQKKVIELGAKMNSENLSLKDEILEQSLVRLKNDTLDNGVARLIHNHAINKKTLGMDILGLGKKAYTQHINEMIENGVISEPYVFNKNHMFTLYQVHQILDHQGIERYSDNHEPVVVCVGNYKGGTGKTTTTISLAMKTALDLELNAQVLIVDLDPQGSSKGIITIDDPENEIFITLSDLVRAEFEREGGHCSPNDVNDLMDNGFSFEDIVLNTPFNTHIPNLNLITAFPTDEAFTKLYWTLNEEKRTELLTSFAKKVVPILKQRFDIIFLDLPPQNSPITWSAIEAADMMLAPVTPRTYDYVSTMSYLNTMGDQLLSMPSQGKNIQWFKVLPVNYNKANKHERKTYDRLLRTIGGDMITKPIKHSHFFHEAAERNRTIFDIIRSESLCTDAQYNDAIDSVNEVYESFISDLKVLTSKIK